MRTLTVQSIASMTAIILLAAVLGGVEAGIMFGTYTVPLQIPSEWGALNSWLRANQSRAREDYAQTLRVVEVGWAPTDKIQSQIVDILRVWTYAEAVPIITWMPYPYKTWTNPSPCKDIANGMYDDYIDQFLGNLSKTYIYGRTPAYTRKAYLRFAPSPNGNWFPWAPSCPPCGNTGQKIDQTAADYQAMWKYVIGKIYDPKYNFTKEYLQVVFDVSTANENGTPAQFAPDQTDANSKADWFVTTGVNWGNTLPGNSWVGAKSLFTPALQALSAIDSTVPLGIVSAGTTSHPNGREAKNEWISDLCDMVTDPKNNIKMYTYHNADSSTDIAMFGGARGVVNWTTPFGTLPYRTYPAWRECVIGPGFVPRDPNSEEYVNSTVFQGK